MSPIKTPCTKCNTMTWSKRIGRAHYHCEICDGDKSLSDYFFWEADLSIKRQENGNKN